MATSRRTSSFLRKKAAEKAPTKDVKRVDSAIWRYKPLRLPYKPAHLTQKQIEDAVDKLAA